MRARLSAGVVLAALLGLAALLAPAATAESSPSAYGDRLVALINQAREQHGLRALTVASGTSTVATHWTEHLDSQQALSHNPDLGPQLESHGSPNWTAYGENVGDGPTSSADAVFQAYMNSPEHRDNILGSAYRYLGVGVVFDGSTAWNTLDFVDQYSTSKPHTAPRTTTQPKATTTTTSPKTVTKTATRPVANPVVHVRAIPVQHPATHPRVPRQHAKVRALAAAAPVAAPAAPSVAQTVSAPTAAALPLPVRVPGGRDTLPFVAAAGMILLVVATRYAAEVLPRRVPVLPRGA